METYNPEYVLILSGDHIYKMDYEVMLEYHKANNADVTIATMQVPMEEASRFGIVITDDNNRITEFERETGESAQQFSFHGYLHIQLEGAQGSAHQTLGRAWM